MLSCYYLTKVRKSGIALKPQMTLIKSPRRHNNEMEAVITFFEEELIEPTLKTGFSADRSESLWFENPILRH